MESTLTLIHRSPELELGIVVTGSHLDDAFGNTVMDIRAADLPVIAEVPVTLAPRNGRTVAHATATQIAGFADTFDAWEPESVIVLGDRPEMLAGALSAALLSIPVWHIHGGERSGSIDESLRHAISKIAHVHCVATEASAERLRRMGESADSIHVLGAPGLDGIVEAAKTPRDELCRKLGIRADGRLGLAVFHPVTQEQGTLGEQVAAVIDAMLDNDLEVVAFRPNSDAGGDEIDSQLRRRAEDPTVHVLAHLERPDYLSLMKHSDIMVGNSSSGILEAASFGLRVVDVGNRQNLRERGDNVVSAQANFRAVSEAIRQSLELPRCDARNIYGDGQAGRRFLDLLEEFDYRACKLAKVNAY